MACPVVAKHEERSEVIIYGGSVHFSKDFDFFDGRKHFGLLVEYTVNGWQEPSGCCYLKSLSQEHGIIKACPDHFENINIGDMVVILPILSCLTANLMRGYRTLEGKSISRF